MKHPDTRSFAIYSRKSKFTGRGESIENQIELCRQRLRSMEVPEGQIVVFEDEGFSGGNTQRPQFQAMMREIRAGKIQGVICYRLDRISRNVLDFAEMQKEFGEHGVDFISLRDNFDTTTPTGRAMMLMSSVFAQLERETIAERIRDNMYELAKSGRWPESCIAELESLTWDTAHSDADFAVLQESLENFSAALRVFVKKIVWDAENIHVFLFGDSEGEVDFSGFPTESVESMGTDAKYHLLIT